MSFEKTVERRIWGVTTQNSTLRFVTGDSVGDAFTNRINPLRGSLMWDKGMFVLQNVAVAGGATGGSYSVTIETDAVIGFTGLPIARAAIGPNSETKIVMDSLHQSSAIPLPTHMNIVQTAAGGGITLTCDVIARQYRGTFGTAGQGSAERVLQGTMLRANSDGDFSGDEGLNASDTFTIGTSGSLMGLNRLRFWDNALFWVIGGSQTDGAYDVDIIASVGGDTVSIATTGTGGAVDIAGDSASQRTAIANNFYGQCPSPAAIIWTEETGGDGVSDVSIVMMAKSGRGSLAKR